MDEKPMDRISFNLNNSTKLLIKSSVIVTALAPLLSNAAVISQSTDVPQIFSTDTEYSINSGVIINADSSSPAVTVTGTTIQSMTNNGTISGNTGNGILIHTESTDFSLNNQQTGNISSENSTAIYVENMAGSINNSGTIEGKDFAIKIGDNVSPLKISNAAKSTIKADTAIDTFVSVMLKNNGEIDGKNGSAIALHEGNSTINNTGLLSSQTASAIFVDSAAKVDISNSGIIEGKGGNAIELTSAKKNTITLNTGSDIKGDVISSNSTSNTLTLKGTGSEDSNFIGRNPGEGFASLKMDGTSWETTGNIDIIGSGDSLLINSGKLTLAGDVTNKGNSLIAQGSTLQLGNGSKTGTLEGGVTNNGSFIFAQAGDTQFDNIISGSGEVVKNDNNRLLLGGVNTYSGNTTLNSGTTLLNAGSALASANIAVNSGAIFASAGEILGNVNVAKGGTLSSWNGVEGTTAASGPTANTINGNLVNSGNLQISSLKQEAGNVFTVNGDYTGQSGSQIMMNSVLADDASPTDRLVIKGSSLGESAVKVNNIGGLGAQTVNGMKVISVGGASDAKFTLASPAVAGAWEYNLNQHSDGSWYLESVATPPTVEPAPEETDTGNNDAPAGGDGSSAGGDGSSAGGNGSSNGDNGSSAGGNGSSEGGDGSSAGGNGSSAGGGYVPAAPELYNPAVGAYLANYTAAQTMFQHKREDRDQLVIRNEDDLNTWMYVNGRYSENSAAGGAISNKANITVLQIGSDIFSKPLGKGIVNGGFMLGAGNTDNRITVHNNRRTASGEVQGFNVGMYATWQEDTTNRTGTYFDSWLALSTYKNTVNSSYMEQEKYNSRGFAASLEAGHAWLMDSRSKRNWKLEPQAQVIYSYLHQDSHTEANGSRINANDNSSVLGRLGLKASNIELNAPEAWQPWVAANWLTGSGSNDLLFNGEKVSNDIPDNRGQLEVGISGRMNVASTVSLRLNGEWGEKDYSAYSAHILWNYRW
ncbi:autotransporter family protein [Dryocola boscaweniae]|uniref:autotransporter family protein n=1 Tax=Dryocola boscaweniae TaxID=2925397 RepID=UPI002FDE3B16